MTPSGAGETFPVRPELVDESCIPGAVLLSLQALIVSLVKAGLTTYSADDSSPASLALSRSELQTVADGYALVAATMATREV